MRRPLMTSNGATGLRQAGVGRIEKAQFRTSPLRYDSTRGGAKYRFAAPSLCDFRTFTVSACGSPLRTKDLKDSTGRNIRSATLVGPRLLRGACFGRGRQRVIPIGAVTLRPGKIGEVGWDALIRSLPLAEVCPCSLGSRSRKDSAPNIRRHRVLTQALANRS